MKNLSQVETALVHGGSNWGDIGYAVGHAVGSVIGGLNEAGSRLGIWIYDVTHTA